RTGIVFLFGLGSQATASPLEAAAMLMVCPQCKGSFDGVLQCPKCRVRLLLPGDKSKQASEGPRNGKWHQTPPGRIIAGLVLGVGIVSGFLVFGGIISGVLAAVVTPFSKDALVPPPAIKPVTPQVMIVYGSMLADIVFGALGGLLGVMIWKPLPKLDLPSSVPS